MIEMIELPKLKREMKNIRDLLEENRDLMDTSEYFASLVTLAAVNIGIENCRQKRREETNSGQRFE